MASLRKMKSTNPVFFKNGRGKGERYNVHRNHLIVTAKNEFTGEIASKIWAYDDENWRLTLIGPTRKSIASAKNFIDKKISLNEMTNNELEVHVKHLALANLPHLCDLVDTNRLQGIAHSLEHTAMHLLRMSEYLNSRCSGNNHTDAVDAQNKMVEKVRKAIGFSYPKDDVIF